ncbi:hypothetical protein ACO9S2_08935 [Nitrospira sp. NS4]|uniref:hypothetical protein n=1 Tax=Nitrospira sp. NS4 TaxID=3414498 RepID=UPI003C30A1B0
MSSQHVTGSEKWIGIFERAVLWGLISSFIIVLFVGTSWATGFNKSNSLTIENDPRTSSWTATCDISVSGVDEDKIYSGVMRIQYLPWDGATAVPVFNAVFQVDPANRAWTESLPGDYSVKAILKGHDIAVHAEFKFNTPISGDRISCGSRIDQGPLSSAISLFGSNMVNTVALP